MRLFNSLKDIYSDILLLELHALTVKLDEMWSKMLKIRKGMSKETIENPLAAK